MNRKRPYDDKALLMDLYVTRGMTIAEIARELHATSVTIQKYLKKHAIPSRGRGPRKGRKRTAPAAATNPMPMAIDEATRRALLRLVEAAVEAPPPQKHELLGHLRRTLQQA